MITQVYLSERDVGRLVDETLSMKLNLVQADMQKNRIARYINRAGTITNFTENCTGKSFLFLNTQILKYSCS